MRSFRLFLMFFCLLGLANQAQAQGGYSLASADLSGDEVLVWAAEVAEQVLSNDYRSYRSHSIRNRAYFTDTGWYSLSSQDYGVDWYGTEQITEEQLVVARAIHRGWIYPTNRQGVWNVEVPVDIEYYKAYDRRPHKYVETRNVHMRIVRVPSSVNSAGLGVESWNVGPRRVPPYNYHDRYDRVHTRTYRY